MKTLVILGSGGGALDVLDIMDAINRDTPVWEIAGFLDDAAEVGGLVWGLPVLGRLGDAPRFADAWFINAIGSDRSFRDRPEVIARTGIPPDQFATIVHPLASVSPRARLGRGTSVGPGVVIGGGATIGDHVTICPGTLIGHDASIGPYSILAPGAIVSGGVRIGRTAYVGAGAMIRQRLRIGERALVGLGAVAIRDVPPDAVVVGNPARSLPARNSMETPSPQLAGVFS